MQGKLPLKNYNIYLIDSRSKIRNKFLKMIKFSSQEIESQYNLIKTLLSDPEKYKDALDAIKKDIAYMTLELKKKTWRREYYFINNILEDLEIFTK